MRSMLSLLAIIAAAAVGVVALRSLPREHGAETARIDVAAVDLSPPRAATGSHAEAAQPPSVATTPAEVREVYHYARNAEPENIATLRHLALRSADPLVAGNAIGALGRLGGISDDDEVVALAEDSRPRVRHEAVRALGVGGDREVVGRLVELADNDDATTAALAIEALGRLGGEAAKRKLRGVLVSADASALAKAFARQALRTAEGRDS